MPSLDLRPTPLTLRLAAGQSLDVFAQLRYPTTLAPFPTVGASVEAFIFDRNASGTPPADQFGATIGDGGLVALGLTAAKTTALLRTPGWGFAVFVTLASGNRFCALRGQLEITLEHAHV